MNADRRLPTQPLLGAGFEFRFRDGLAVKKDSFWKIVEPPEDR